MRHPFGAFLIAAATLLLSSPAFGTASATVIVNGTGRTLSQTGFLFEQIGAVGVNLQPGQSSSFTFEYSIGLEDSGQPVAFDQRAIGCSSIFPSTCNDAYTGFEYAKAYLIVLAEDPRVTHNPAVVQEGLRGSVTLATHGDSFAELLTQSGTLQGRIEVRDVPGANTFTNVYPTFLALWVLANPIPEPTVVAQMLAGLTFLGFVVRRRVKDYQVRTSWQLRSRIQGSIHPPAAFRRAGGDARTIEHIFGTLKDWMGSARRGAGPKARGAGPKACTDIGQTSRTVNHGHPKADLVRAIQISSAHSYSASTIFAGIANPTGSRRHQRNCCVSPRGACYAFRPHRRNRVQPERNSLAEAVGVWMA
jgi:hypothetical protein